MKTVLFLALIAVILTHSAQVRNVMLIIEPDRLCTRH